MSSSTIIQTLQNGVTQQVLRNYGITRLWLFGSYVRGEEKEDSDIDLLYDIDYDKPYEGWGPISALGFLEEKFGKSIDLINIDNIHPLLEKQILSDKQLIF